MGDDTGDAVEERLRRALARDLDAGFDDLVRTHGDVVYSVARNLAARPSDAEDLAAEALLRAYRALRGYDARRIGALSVRPWLLTIRYTLVGRNGRPYVADRPGTLGGWRRGRIYGRLDCPSALRAVARGYYVGQRVFFADEATARAAGYRPCAVCLPADHATWKEARCSS